MIRRAIRLAALVTLAALVNIAAGVAPAFAQSAAPPAVLFVDIDAGPVSGGPQGLGVPISIFGHGFGATRGTSRVTIGGVEVAAYLVWGSGNAQNPTLDMIVVQPGPSTTGGPIVVEVGGQASNATHRFTAAQTKLRYVAPAGSDSADCAQATPCATISRAIDPAISGPGDTILVRGPVHAEGEIWVRREYGHGGSAGLQKTIKAYPGESVALSNASRPFYVDADYVTVSGFTFQNGKSIGVPDAGDTARRRGNRLINNSAAGAVTWSFMDSHGDDHLLAGNVCEATTSSQGTQGHCFYISYGNGVRLLYNIGSGAPGYGIHVFDQRRATTDFRRTISNLLIEGNILKSSKLRSGLIIAMVDEGGYGNSIENVIVRNNIITANSHLGITVGGLVHHLKIYNNTIYENGRQGVNVGSDGVADVDIRNNLIMQSENANCLNDCQWYATAHIQSAPGIAQLVVDNNAYGPGAATLIGAVDARPVTGTNSFADPARFDFRLLAGSAAIDRGTSLGTVATDYWGLVRPQGSAPDPGAFETLANGGARPSAPSGLRVISSVP